MICPWIVLEFCLSEVVRTKQTNEHTQWEKRDFGNISVTLLSVVNKKGRCSTCFIYVLFVFWLSVIILQGVDQSFFLSRRVNEMSENGAWRVICALHINSHCKKVHKRFVDYFTNRIVNLQKKMASLFSLFWNTLYKLIVVTLQSNQVKRSRR